MTVPLFLGAIPDLSMWQHSQEPLRAGVLPCLLWVVLGVPGNSWRLDCLTEFSQVSGWKLEPAVQLVSPLELQAPGSRGAGERSRQRCSPQGTFAGQVLGSFDSSEQHICMQSTHSIVPVPAATGIIYLCNFGFQDCVATSDYITQD